MTRPSSAVPGYAGGDDVSGSTGAAAARYDDAGVDPTNEQGQYPPGDWATAIFGGQLPDGTGAPGTQGARIGEPTDPTNEPGQTQDGLTGITEEQITSTGAPGSQGITDGGDTGPDAVTFTRPGSYLSGSYAQDTVSDSVGGPQDWTQANDGGYGTGGPKLPGMAEPTPNAGPFQPRSGGRVLRGGRDVRPWPVAANGFSSGIAYLTEDVTPVCPVPENGVRVKNIGGTRVYFGGPDVDSSSATGYPLDPGDADDFPGARAKESPVVPAPPGDMDPPVLHARVCPGGGTGKVSWISVAMT